MGIEIPGLIGQRFDQGRSRYGGAGLLQKPGKERAFCLAERQRRGTGSMQGPARVGQGPGGCTRVIRRRIVRRRRQAAVEIGDGHGQHVVIDGFGEEKIGAHRQALRHEFPAAATGQQDDAHRVELPQVRRRPQPALAGQADVQHDNVQCLDTHVAVKGFRARQAYNVVAALGQFPDDQGPQFVLVFDNGDAWRQQVGWAHEVVVGGLYIA